MEAELRGGRVYGGGGKGNGRVGGVGGGGGGYNVLLVFDEMGDDIFEVLNPLPQLRDLV